MEQRSACRSYDAADVRLARGRVTSAYEHVPVGDEGDAFAVLRKRGAFGGDGGVAGVGACDYATARHASDYPSLAMQERHVSLLGRADHRDVAAVSADVNARGRVR